MRLLCHVGWIWNLTCWTVQDCLSLRPIPDSWSDCKVVCGAVLCLEAGCAGVWAVSFPNNIQTDCGVWWNRWVAPLQSGVIPHACVQDTTYDVLPQAFRLQVAYVTLHVRGWIRSRQGKQNKPNGRNKIRCHGTGCSDGCVPRQDLIRQRLHLYASGCCPLWYVSDCPSLPDSADTL